MRSSSSRKPPFEEVARTELPVLYRVARRLARNDAEAEDLVGTTLLLAARAYDAFDGRHPRAWTIQILRNEFFGQARKRANRPETALDSVAEPSDEGFWREVEWRAVGGDLMRALDGLPEAYRLAVALCDVEEMSYNEVALAMEVPVGTVRSRLFRGRRLLRARLADSFPA